MSSFKVFKPNNSFHLGILVAVVLLISVAIPMVQILSIMLPVELVIAYSDCGYCALTNLNIFFIILIFSWTFFCIYKINKNATFKPWLLFLYMLVGYLITNNVLAISFEKDALRSNDAFKILFIYSTAPYASITPFIYGVIFYLIEKSNLKSKTTP